MGMLFQFGALFTDMSVFENVAFPMREHTDMSDDMIRDLVLHKMSVGFAIHRFSFVHVLFQQCR